MQQNNDGKAEAKQRQVNMLSPFTWNHLTLPVINNAHQSLQLKTKKQKISNPLATIVEKEPNPKTTKPTTRNTSLQKETNLKKQPLETVSRPRRYSHKHSIKQTPELRLQQQRKKAMEGHKVQSKLNATIHSIGKQQEKRAGVIRQNLNKTMEIREDNSKDKRENKNRVKGNKEQNTKKNLDRAENRDKSKIIKLNKTKDEHLSQDLDIISHKEKSKDREKDNLRSKPVTTDQGKRIRFLSQKNNMEKYLRMNLTQIGWQETKKDQKQAKLLWSNWDRPNDYSAIQKGQFYNHIKGSHCLTSKDQLHYLLQGQGLGFYPLSFYIPKQYQLFMRENSHIAVKAMLRTLAVSIFDFFAQSAVPADELMNDRIPLSLILESSILKTGHEETTLLIKLCMYLELLRLQSGYCNYFETFEGYHKITIKPKQHLFEPLINKAVHYLHDGLPSTLINFRWQEIDYRLLVLLLHYDRLFKENDDFYDYDNQLWIVKPIASSRGAGISVLKASPQFCMVDGSEWSQYKNRRKYDNKIIQRYIPNPYLLEFGDYAGRKFDIRQWVLIASDQNRPIVYRYHTGYCRFSSRKFSLQKTSKEIHLTNYSVFQEEGNEVKSVMMLEELFQVSRNNLRGKYVQQTNQIIIDIIQKNYKLHYQEGCFELLGFDFLMDDTGILHLLQINLNPACASHRYPKLQQQTQTMAQTMLALVTEQKQTDKWIAVLGQTEQTDRKSQLADVSQIDVRPFYPADLGEESLISWVRHLKQVIKKVKRVVNRYYYRQFMMRVIAEFRVEGRVEPNGAQPKRLSEDCQVNPSCEPTVVPSS